MVVHLLKVGLKYDTWKDIVTQVENTLQKLSERRLGYHLENKSTGGSSNESIFLALSQNTQHIKNEDICVLGLTHPHRQPIFYRTPTKKFKMTQVGDHWKNGKFSKNTFEREKIYRQSRNFKGCYT